MAAAVTRITSFAPQLLVDDLDRAIGFYRDLLGFSFGRPGAGFTPSANAMDSRFT
jgi:catechol 2,3-dioxygenase-like lactoylglutathione lyase family enzyme